MTRERATAALSTRALPTMSTTKATSRPARGSRKAKASVEEIMKKVGFQAKLPSDAPGLSKPRNKAAKAVEQATVEGDA